MEAVSTVVTAQGLHAILTAIAGNDHGARIRFRTLGQLWYPNFLRIQRFEDGKRILFHDERRKFFISLRDISAISEFELDAAVAECEAYTPYQVSDNEITMTRNRDNQNMDFKSRGKLPRTGVPSDGSGHEM